MAKEHSLDIPGLKRKAWGIIPPLRGYLPRTFSLAFPLKTQKQRKFVQLAKGAGALRDAVLRDKTGTTVIQAVSIASKISGGAAFTGALLAVAGVVGTASTGTAIGSLSGAAFTSAALAWLGGSVAVGSAILTGGSIVIGIGTAYVIKKWALSEIYAPRRQDEEISDEERLHVQAIQNLVIALEKLKTEEIKYPEAVLRLCWGEILDPATELFEEKLKSTYNTWPWGSRHQVKKALKVLKENKINDEQQVTSAVPIGIVSVVVLKLLGSNYNFTHEQTLVLDAFRRSTTMLTDASPEDISSYLETYSQKQLSGVLNNVKGIYHEIAYVDSENTDNDNYLARVFPDTSHIAGDVEIIDANTGEVVDVIQLKATNSVQHIAHHLENYQGIGIQVTEELASAEGLDSSGFSNEGLATDVKATIAELQQNDSFWDQLETTSQGGITAAMVAFLISTGSRLRAGNSATEAARNGLPDAKRALIGGAITALVAELIT